VRLSDRQLFVGELAEDETRRQRCGGAESMKNPVVQQMKQKQKKRTTVNEQAGHPDILASSTNRPWLNLQIRWLGGV
jgi:hypothetical protein